MKSGPSAVLVTIAAELSTGKSVGPTARLTRPPPALHLFYAIAMPSISEETRARLLRTAAAIALWVYKGSLYYLSLLGPVLILSYFPSLPIAVLLALGIAGFGVAGCVFITLLILTKKLFIGHIEASGIESVHSQNGQRWFVAAMVAGILGGSPFRSLIGMLSPMANWYYRGMGARMPNSVLLGGGARISDPFFLELGENVNVGAEAVILGHLGHGKDILLGRVVIGEGTVVGMRAVIFPNVRIGRHACIGAGALVVRGTVIADGETWAGIPARRISRRPSEAEPCLGNQLASCSERSGS